MKKFKWIAQDGNGAIWKFEKKPELIRTVYKRNDAGGVAYLVSQALDKAVTPIRINLKKNGYEIKDGILHKAKICSFPKVRGLTITITPTRAYGPDDETVYKLIGTRTIKAWLKSLSGAKPDER